MSQPEMIWLEYNIHIRSDITWYQDTITTLIDLIEPFVEAHRGLFRRWHYLIEPDECRRRGFAEIRIRFEGEQTNLDKIKEELVSEIKDFSVKTSLVMSEEESRGSHEGCHGERDEIYKGIESERDFKQDWSLIVEIFQIGSESALKILRYYPNLRDRKSRGLREHEIRSHPNFLHYPANQLLVEP